jgi:hypothetical protein
MTNIPDDIFTEPEDVSPDTASTSEWIRSIPVAVESGHRVDHADGRHSWRSGGPGGRQGQAGRTELAIRGQTPPCNRKDTNTLRRIAAPTPSPLVGLLKGA